MLKNCQHNLIHQLSETADSLWRMDQYIEDAKKENCQEGVEFWQKFKETLETQLEMLKKQLKKVVQEENF